MSKGLEAIEQYKKVVCPNCQYNYGDSCHNKDQCFSMIIEKELKALEIIKNKCVDCWGFISDISVTSEEESVYAFSPIDLTKEEIDLLKEVLL